MISLDLVQTLAFAGVVLFLGYGMRRLVPPLARYNIPAPVLGGLLVASAVLVGHLRGVTLFAFDTTLQTPLQTAFFTTIGFGASVGLLRSGGPLVFVFLVLSSGVALLQNLAGVVVARALGEAPLLGVLAGSVTLTGGPATGLAFAPIFEQAGVAGAATVAVAAAMAGIVAGGLLGGPLGTLLVQRHRLRVPGIRGAAVRLPTAANVVEARIPEPAASTPAGEDVETYSILKALVAILVAMWIGGWLSRGFAAAGVTLPAYIGAMLVAALMRNVDDFTGLFGLSQRTLDDLGNVALALFLVLALMTLELLRLLALAVPLTVILVVQVALIAWLAYWLVYRLMGRDYEAVVMSSGFCGFMLGTTANAMANMDALTQRYGPAPKAFLVVPMVGAFFIDFINAIMITALVNAFR
ncbi:MAG: sodium/glutamate symporter [Vicinamibacterales bacterium]